MNGNTAIQREDLSVKQSDEGPILQIGDDLQVLLSVYLETDDDYWSTKSDYMTTDVDADPDAGAWWTIWPKPDLHPTITIEPEVLPADE